MRGSGQKAQAPPRITSCLPHPEAQSHQAALLPPRRPDPCTAQPVWGTEQRTLQAGLVSRSPPPMPAALGATKSAVLPGPAPKSFCFCFTVSVATTSLPPIVFLSSVTLPSEEASFSLLYATRRIKVGGGRRSGQENGDGEGTSGVQPGAGAVTVCPPQRPLRLGLPTGSSTAGFSKCDCPAPRACRALQERLWLLGGRGVSRLHKLAGPKYACHCPSSPTSALGLDRVHPPATRPLLVGTLPPPRPGCKVAPQEVPTPSELPTTPLYPFLCHPTFPPADGLLPCKQSRCPPHSMSQQGCRRPRGTWGHRDPGSSLRSTTSWRPALHKFALELCLPRGRIRMALTSSRAVGD